MTISRMRCLTPRLALCRFALLARRGEFASRPNLRTVFVEEERNNRQKDTYTADQRTTATHAHGREHLTREQRRGSTTSGPHNSVGCEGRSSVDEVYIDEVVKVGDKYQQHVGRQNTTADGGYNPVYRAVEEG